MNLLDILIIGLFFAFTIYLGFRYGTRSNSGSDYFLGSRNLPWWVLAISLVATETSTLTFLGIPALSYKGDYSFLSLAIGFIIGRIISSIYILPLYMNGGYTSIYEWVGDRFGKSSQKSLSILFAIIRILSDGVRLYAASLPLSFLLVGLFPESWSFEDISIISLAIISIATIIYSAYGGFRAVVWTDLLQFIVYFIGGILVLILLWTEFGNPWQQLPSQRFTIFHFSPSLPDGSWDPYFFLFSIPGGILLSLGSHGTDQMIVQRLLACKNQKESQLALISSGFLVFFQFLLFLGIGSFLYFAIPDVEIPNRVFSEYIVNHLTTPLLGFILAGVFASSMSTLSSTLNSLTLTTRIDWGIGRNRKYSGAAITIVWGIVLFVSSTLPFFLDEKTKSSIVELGLSFASFVFGPMVALFFLEILPIPKIPKSSLHPYFLPTVLFLGIGSCFWIQSILLPPFTWIVGMGILFFYLYYSIGILTITIWRRK